MKRHDERRADQLRPLSITYNIFEYAAGSVLFELGKTKIVCAVTLQPSVPSFLRGKGVGWLTAEYALLPASTRIRTNREVSVMRRSSRSVEISRLIGRVLRVIIDDTVIGERTIMIDCDVLQADGGTRVASIIAACAALVMAQDRWLEAGVISSPFIKDEVAAVSVGMLEGNMFVLDPDFKEDSSSSADINVIMTHSGRLIEVQGGAEKEPIEWNRIEEVWNLAKIGLATLVQFLALHRLQGMTSKKEKVPLFSLYNRHGQNVVRS